MRYINRCRKLQESVCLICVFGWILKIRIYVWGSRIGSLCRSIYLEILVSWLGDDSGGMVMGREFEKTNMNIFDV